jgi:hypothetical protein
LGRRFHSTRWNSYCLLCFNRLKELVSPDQICLEIIYD